MGNGVEGLYNPQQTVPAAGVPAWGGVLNLVGVYDTRRGFWVGLPIEALTEALVVGEKQHAFDRIDSRNGRCSLTVPIGTEVGQSKSAEIEVPSGEVWYLRNHEIRVHQAAALSAGDLICNFRVSRFPKVNDVDKLFYSTEDRLVATQTDIAAGDVTDHRSLLVGAYFEVEEVQVKRDVLRDFADPDELGNALRLFGGDKLTLVVTVAEAETADAAVEVDLTVWGLRGKRLVE